MELRCLPETDNRIALWRNTLQLFHNYKKVQFTGPFFAADYRDYRVESSLSNKLTGQPQFPDIFACGPNGWAVIDLTLSNHSKKDQLDSYKDLDPRDLSIYGYPTYPTPPDTMSSRLVFNSDDGDHCEMVVLNLFDIRKEHFIQDLSLRQALLDMKGKDLSKLPEIPVSLVPEMKNFEIRRGIIDIVMQLFDGKSEGKTSYQICEEGLERIFPLIPPRAKQSLVDGIDYVMDILVRNDLAGYLEHKDGKYRATEKFKQYAKSRQFVAMKLKEWAHPTQRTIADFRQ